MGNLYNNSEYNTVQSKLIHHDALNRGRIHTVDLFKCVFEKRKQLMFCLYS